MHYTNELPGLPTRVTHPGQPKKYPRYLWVPKKKFQIGYLTLEPSKESAGLEKVPCVLKRKKFEDFFSIVMILE